MSEDLLLANTCKNFGRNWDLVADCVENRSAVQCEERWHEKLDPAIDHSEWREEEDTVLIRTAQQTDRIWYKMQKEYLPRRSVGRLENICIGQRHYQDPRRSSEFDQDLYHKS